MGFIWSEIKIDLLMDSRRHDALLLRGQLLRRFQKFTRLQNLNQNRSIVFAKMYDNIADFFRGINIFIADFPGQHISFRLV